MSSTAEKKIFTVRQMVYIAICSALIAVCSQISIPLPWGVPVTLQTFAVFFAVGLLGMRDGTISVIIFILLGAAGIPVFANFKGGMGVLMGTTGGYIMGFVFSALITGLIMKYFGKNIVPMVIAMVAGLLVCYAFGTAWFMVVYAQANGAVGLMTALGWCVIPYIIPDIVKIVLAVVLLKSTSKLIKY